MTVRRANSNELYHHGIKGQKWGVRRFQTKAGSLTAAGKKRYAKYQKKESAYKAKLKKISKPPATLNKVLAIESPPLVSLSVPYPLSRTDTIHCVLITPTSP